jgi:hypothetical protein
MVCFEKLSGMRINYHKSDLTPINLEEDECQNYAQIFYCKFGNFPLDTWESLSIIINSEGRTYNLL